MDSNYIKAIEIRARWLRYARSMGSLPSNMARGEKNYWLTGLPGYVDCLENGDSFFMNSKFCSLVEHARVTVPDDLVFDSSWLQAPQGFLWIEEPFKVPITEEEKAEAKASNYFPTISAIGWRPVPEGQQTAKGMIGDVAGRVAGKGAYQFLTFLCFPGEEERFGCWSYFLIQDGDKLVDRIRQFEGISKEVGGAYPNEKESDMLHEIRWIYSAMYLMAQRLAISVQHNTDRHTRRRNEFAKLKVTPFIRVITLRRMEEARQKASKGEAIEFQWHWEVRGHWRNQYFPSENTHKPVFIDAYIKGNLERPFKSPGVKLFVAGR